MRGRVGGGFRELFDRSVEVLGREGEHSEFKEMFEAGRKKEV